VAIIALLIAILVPSLSNARRQAKTTLCLTRLHTLGQGLVMYSSEYGDVLVPGRMPKVDDYNVAVDIAGGLKYRPTFLAIMGSQIGIPPFDDPQPNRLGVDRFGEPGDQQNYASETYVCPEAADWTDERNGAYGYNYQFLGNSRLRDSADATSYKNWPVPATRIRSPAGCVAIADAVGTAASFATLERLPYINNAKDAARLGNEGFNLDPPVVDPVKGEMTDLPAGHRSSVHERHRGRAVVLWVDSHGSTETLKSLGYEVDPSGIVLNGTLPTASNRLWSPDQSSGAWIQDP